MSRNFTPSAPRNSHCPSAHWYVPNAGLGPPGPTVVDGRDSFGSVNIVVVAATIAPCRGSTTARWPAPVLARSMSDAMAAAAPHVPCR